MRAVFLSALLLISIAPASAQDGRANELLRYKVLARSCAISFSPPTAVWIDRMVNSITDVTEQTLIFNGEFATASKSAGLVTFCWSLRDELLSKGLIPG